MRAIGRFTVRPVLPEALAALGELAQNLRWSWHPETQAVFREVDAALWESTGRDPVKLLGAVGRDRFERAGRRRRLPRPARRGARRPGVVPLRGPLVPEARRPTAPRPSATSRPSSASPRCCRSTPAASASWPATTSRRPATWACRSSASACSTGTATSSSRCPARAGSRRPTRSWTPTACRSRALLEAERRAGDDLDRPARRPAAGRADLGGQRRPRPAADARHRRRGQPRPLRRRHRPAVRRQQRAPPAPGAAPRRRRRPGAPRPLAGSPAPRPRRCSTPTRATPASWASSGSASSPSPRAAPSSTSTPRSRWVARPPSSPPTRRCPPASTASRATLIEQYFSQGGATPGVPIERILALGTEDYDGGDASVFNMAVMGFRLAQRANGVSVLHGEVSRGMFNGLWPAFDEAEVPIGSITNGVHAPTLGRPRGVRPGRRARAPTRTATTPRPFWAAVDKVPGPDIWAVKRQLRERLVVDARKRLLKSWQQRGVAKAELGWIDSALDPDVLTIGFARRAASYKRLTLMMRDPDAAQAPAAPPGAADPAGHRRQGAPGRRRRQEADPGHRPAVRRPGDPAPDRVPAQLRHRDGAAALPGLRRLAEQPAAARTRRAARPA